MQPRSLTASCTAPLQKFPQALSAPPCIGRSLLSDTRELLTLTPSARRPLMGYPHG